MANIEKELEKKVEGAIKLLKTTAPKDGSAVEVAYSGGKDSDVILQLAKESGINYRAIYKCTTIDPRGTIKHAKDMGAEIKMPRKDMTFFKLIDWKGLPSRWYRFCCDYLKEYRSDESISKTIIGVRKAESTKRAKLYKEPTKCIGTKTKPHEGIYPILDWTDEDVKAFLESRNITCAPVYYDDEGKFHVERRLGCIACPLSNKATRISQFKQYPRMLNQYAKHAQIYLDAHPTTNTAKYYSNAYEWLVCNIFYDNNYQEFSLHADGMFGRIDCKQFLENYFGIKF